MAQVLSNLPKNGEPVRYVDVIDDGTKQRLCVDAVFGGSISIGAIKIEDASGSPTANVVLTPSGLAGLVVVPQIQAVQKVNQFGSGMIAAAATVTLVSYTVPVAKRFNFTGGIVGGSGPGEFTFYVNGVAQCLVRNSGSSRTVQLTFIEPPEASAGQVIEIKAKNIDTRNWSFESTLSGHLVDA